MNSLQTSLTSNLSFSHNSQLKRKALNTAIGPCYSIIIIDRILCAEYRHKYGAMHKYITCNRIVFIIRKLKLLPPKLLHLSCLFEFTLYLYQVVLSIFTFLFLSVLCLARLLCLESMKIEIDS